MKIANNIINKWFSVHQSFNNNIELRNSSKQVRNDISKRDSKGFHYYPLYMLYTKDDIVLDLRYHTDGFSIIFELGSILV